MREREGINRTGDDRCSGEGDVTAVSQADQGSSLSLSLASLLTHAKGGREGERNACCCTRVVAESAWLPASLTPSSSYLFIEVPTE